MCNTQLIKCANSKQAVLPALSTQKYVFNHFLKPATTKNAFKTVD